MELSNEEGYYKHFTDRIEARKIFWNEYDILNKEINNAKLDSKKNSIEIPTSKQVKTENTPNLHIINYYGIGGMGKTTLINQLIKELSENGKENLPIFLDAEDFNNIPGILSSIRNILSENCKIKFNKFDIALIIYLKKVGKCQDSPEIKNILNSNPIAKLIGDTISNVSVPMFLLKTGLDKLINIGMNQKYKKFIQSIEIEQLPNNILENLPQYLADDINSYLENKNKKIIFFFDTFEKLDESTIGSTASLNKFKWLYNARKTGIINKIQKSMFVIGSREKINSIPEVQYFKLDKFNEKDSFEYLNKAGIKDENICKEIYSKYSNGLPLMLSTCVDSYSIDSNQLLVQNISDSSQGLIEKLIGSLDLDSQALVYFLSCVEKWNDDFIMKNAQKCLANFTSYRYENIKKLSFISKDLQGNYTFDKTIEKILHSENTIFANNMKDLMQKTNNFLVEYFADKLDNNNSTITEKNIALKQYIKRKILLENNKNELIKDYELIKPNLIELKKLFLFDDLTNILNILLEKYNNILEVKNQILETQIDILYLSGQYKEEEIKAQQYYELDKNNISAIEKLAIAYMHNSKYNIASEMINKVLNKTEQIDLKNYIRVLMEVSEIESRLGEYNKTLDNYFWIKENLNKIYNGIELLNKQVEIEKHIAKTYSYNGDYVKAIDIYKKILNIKDDETVFLDENKELLTIDELNFYNELSNTYSNNNQFEKALKIKQKLLEFYTEILGEKHPLTLNVKNDIGMIESHMQNYEESIQLLQETYKDRKEVLGEEHLSTVATLNNLAIVNVFYADSLTDKNLKEKIYKESLEELEKVYIIRKQNLGETHTSTLRTLFNISKNLKELGKKKEAIEIAEKVYEIRKNIFGEENSETIKAKQLIEEILRKE